MPIVEIPFNGGDAVARAQFSNFQNRINLYPEIETAGARSRVVMYGTPGLELLVRLAVRRGALALRTRRAGARLWGASKVILVVPPFQIVPVSPFIVLTATAATRPVRGSFSWPR